MKDLGLNTLEELTEAVFEEHVRQIVKWGVQEHDASWWLCFLGEEVGELNQAIAEWQFRGGSAENVSKEAIQVATLALKICEMFDDVASREFNSGDSTTLYISED